MKRKKVKRNNAEEVTSIFQSFVLRACIILTTEAHCGYVSKCVCVCVFVSSGTAFPNTPVARQHSPRLLITLLQSSLSQLRLAEGENTSIT